jgi:hypothetical protein
MSKKDILFCADYSDTLEFDIESIVQDVEPGTVIKVEEYERVPVESSRSVENAFCYLEEILCESFGGEDCELIDDLDFEKFKSEVTSYINGNLRNWNCEKNGISYKIKVVGDCDWIDIED